MKTILLLASMVLVMAHAGWRTKAKPQANAALLLQTTNTNTTMKQKINIVTIGAVDFEKMLAFYKHGLGWPTKATPTDKIAFFNLSGLVLAICDMKVLGDDAGLHLNTATPTHITIAQNLPSEDEVKKAFEAVAKAGATIVKAPQKASWGGFSGYFADPEGNLWEIAYNPYFPLDKDGNVLLP